MPAFGVGFTRHKMLGVGATNLRTFAVSAYFVIAQAHYVEKAEQSPNGTDVYYISQTANNVGPIDPNETLHERTPCRWTFF
jgi:hypothetical protein